MENHNEEHFRTVLQQISGRVHRTPLQSSRFIGDAVGAEVYLKCENLQKTGSFKARGVLNYIRGMDQESKERGVVTVSAGNHAQAVAWGASASSVQATVVMPETAPRSKVEASIGYGARVVLHGTVFDAFQEALRLRDDEGYTFVHPFDHPDVISGQATVAIEAIDELAEIDAIVVPVGGGGLIAGIATAATAVDPSIRVFGVEPSGAPAMTRSLDEGKAVHLEQVDTIADGLAAPMAGDLTYSIVERLVEDVVTVSDDEIRRAMTVLLSRSKLLTEPGGAAAVAALLSERIPVRPGSTVVAVLSGGNVDLDSLPRLLLNV